jgi:hypothetical protein
MRQVEKDTDYSLEWARPNFNRLPQALKFTLSMLKNQDMDCRRLNKQAGITKMPKVG